MTLDIDWSRFLAFITAIAGFIAGWAIASWDSKNRASRRIGEAEAKAEAALRQAKGEAERAAMAARAAPPSLPGTTLLRLWLDAAERPNLELDGQGVDTARISEPHRKRLVGLLSVMRPWIEGRPAAAAPQPAPPSTVAAVPPSFAPPPPAPIATPVIPPAKKDEKPAAPLSIVAQIDEILQARLASTTFAGRGIRLQESPEGGAIVWVGMQQFAGVADVPDPEIQAIIRAATTEWENKYTPG